MSEPRNIYDRIFEHPRPFNFVFAGAGHSLVKDLLDKPGASKVVWGITIPYSQAMMTEYIQDWPGGSRYDWADPAVSKNRVDDMVSHAADTIDFYENGLWTAIAVTAALQTDRERKGKDHFWVARRDAETQDSRLLYGNLSDLLTRQAQEALIKLVVLQEMADACGIKFDYDISSDLMTLEEK